MVKDIKYVKLFNDVMKHHENNLIGRRSKEKFSSIICPEGKYIVLDDCCVFYISKEYDVLNWNNIKFDRKFVRFPFNMRPKPTELKPVGVVSIPIGGKDTEVFLLYNEQKSEYVCINRKYLKYIDYDFELDYLYFCQENKRGPVYISDGVTAPFAYILPIKYDFNPEVDFND